MTLLIRSPWLPLIVSSITKLRFNSFPFSFIRAMGSVVSCGKKGGASISGSQIEVPGWLYTNGYLRKMSNVLCCNFNVK